MSVQSTRRKLLLDVASNWDADARLRFYELATSSDRAYEALTAMIVELVGSRVGSSSRILDAGCGLGFLASILSATGNDVSGIDLSPRSIEHARRAFGDKAHFAVADVAELPLQHQQKYDAVVANMVMHNYPYLTSFLEGCKGALTGSGVFIGTIADPAAYLAKQNLPYRDDSYCFRVSLKHASCRGTHAKVLYFHRQVDTYVTALKSTGFREISVTRAPRVSPVYSRSDIVRFTATA